MNPVFFLYLFSGLVLGVFSPFAVLWMGPDKFNDGTPYVLSAIGGVIGVLIYFSRRKLPVRMIGMGLGLGIGFPTVAFLVFHWDIQIVSIGLTSTLSGLFTGAFIGKVSEMEPR